MLTELFDTVNRERGSAGFTLIELLIVVVIIGILAAIAIPQFSSTKEKAYISAMKSDLRNLATAQEAYYATNNTYEGTSLGNLDNYTSSGDVTVTPVSGNANGWSATASHPALASGGAYCGIAVGSASFPTGGELASTNTRGVPICDNN